MAEQVIDISQDSAYTASSPILASGFHSKRPLFSPNSDCPTHLDATSRMTSHMKLDDGDDAWFSITASRKGNAHYSAFHVLNSGLGFQALMLPLGFTVLGWAWGSICLSALFCWQFYTIWLLIQLHESVPGTMRYSRYLHLSKVAFGEKLGKLLALFPIMYLSGGTCVMLIITAAESMKLFMRIAIGDNDTSNMLPLTTIECYMLFIFMAIVLAHLLPNLNSAAWISFIGAGAALAYCTLFWVISVTKTRPSGISYDPVIPKSNIGSVLNALGIFAFAFRGHNLILEIQATMPSSEMRPSRIPMSRGVNFAYILIALCLFPLAIGGYWAYANKIPNDGGMLDALYIIRQHDTSRFLLLLIILLVVVNCLCSFQLYAMIVFDNLEVAYTRKKRKPCSKWIRSAFRVFFGCLTFFIVVALPFIKGLAGFFGGISLPITFAYPCFMWIAIKKPAYGAMWLINLVLGSFGMILSVLVFAGGVWSLVHPGIDLCFFKP